MAEDGLINCNTWSLMNWQCTMNTHSIMNTWKSESDPEALVSDIFSWAAFFIRTIVSISILVSALFLIFAGGNEKWADKWKNGLKFAILWWVITVFAYVIVRLIQYIA